jgi:TolA-binding protein
VTTTCHHLIDELARPAGVELDAEARLHVSTCDACRHRVEDAERLAAALRGDEPELDDVLRARVLARMSPELDVLAERYAARSGTHRRRWLPILGPILGVAAAAAVVGLWLGHRSEVTVMMARADHPLLAPYVVSGAIADDVATTLLAGRFASLDVKSGQLLRATVGGERDSRIALVGPARLTIGAALDQPTLDLGSGTLLVESARMLHIHAGAVEVSAQNARFGVSVVDHATVVFVDRGELVLDGRRHVRAGEWDGPEKLRSQALVTAVRDHGNAIAPPDDHGGIAAISGDGPVTTEGGAVLGTSPLWARLPAGDVVIVAMSGNEHRVPIAIREGVVARVATSPAPAIVATMDGSAHDDTKVVVQDDAKDKPVRPSSTSSSHDAGHDTHATSDSHRVAAADPAHASGSGDASPLFNPSITTTRVTPVAPAASAPQLYARAESALGAGDRTTAESLWSELVQRFPSSPQAASALYDLAGLARARSDFAAAQADLAKLPSATPAALREPSAYLRCRLHVDAGEPTVAADCFRAFRGTFARSTHDAEVLAWLAGYAQETTGCAAARPLADEYLRLYPNGTFAGRARDCASPP